MSETVLAARGLSKKFGKGEGLVRAFAARGPAAGRRPARPGRAG